MKKKKSEIFQMSEIFQSSKVHKFSEVHVKNNEFHILNTNFKITIGHLRLGLKFEPGVVCGGVR